MSSVVSFAKKEALSLRIFDTIPFVNLVMVPTSHLQDAFLLVTDDGINRVRI